MSRRVLATGLLACLALAAAPSPQLLLNTTASVPVGLYRLAPAGALQVGDLVVVKPDRDLADFLDQGGWLPRGVPLIKPVAAVDGQTVCRLGEVLTIDGKTVARALQHDGRGRRLPTWSGCRVVATDEVFLLASAFGSLDGRYFGVTGGGQIQARAYPLLVTPRANER
jgi:conjugative transfer signal peptidase TraF